MGVFLLIIYLLAVLSIETELSEALDIKAVIDRFSSIDQGRRLRLK